MFHFVFQRQTFQPVETMDLSYSEWANYITKVQETHFEHCWCLFKSHTPFLLYRVV